MDSLPKNVFNPSSWQNVSCSKNTRNRVSLAKGSPPNRKLAPRGTRTHALFERHQPS